MSYLFAPRDRNSIADIYVVSSFFIVNLQIIALRKNAPTGPKCLVGVWGASRIDFSWVVAWREVGGRKSSEQADVIQVEYFKLRDTTSTK